MKKTIFNIFVVLVALIIGFIACKKDDDSTVRELTPEEQERLRILDSLKNLIDADTFFVYDVALPQDDVNYSNVQVQLDSTKLARVLGFSTPAELRTALGTVEASVQTGHTVAWMAINNSTRYDYTEAYTANGIGFWYDANGDVTPWDGSETGISVFYLEHNIQSWISYVGQYPGRLVVDQTGTLINVLENTSEFRVGLIYNVTVGEVPPYEDPETPPPGDPIDVDTTITLSRAYVTDWSATEIDVRGTMRNAFKMTTYQIYEAINDGDMVYAGYNSDGSVYVNEGGDTVSTANYPGHWYSVDGDVTVWGDTISKPVVWSEINSQIETLVMQFGNHPDNASAGNVISFKQKAELNGGSVTFNVNLTLE